MKAGPATLFDELTETLINGLDQRDRLAEAAADGSFTLRLDDEDNAIVDIAAVGSGKTEKARPCDVMTLERREPGSVRDPPGAVPGAAAWRAGVSGFL